MISKKGKIFVLVLLFALMMCVSNGTAYALDNGGFETGDTTGWTINDPTKANVVTTHAGDASPTPLTYSPPDGSSHFIELWAGMGTGTDTTAYQNFTVSNGQWVTGWAAFDARDNYPYNDRAYVKVINADNAVVWYETVASVGNHADGPWTLWESDPLTAGSYKLQFRVVNIKNNLNPSAALFDGATVAPEPVSMLLVGIGLAGLPFVRRFRGFAGKLS